MDVNVLPSINKGSLLYFTLLLQRGLQNTCCVYSTFHNHAKSK